MDETIRYGSYPLELEGAVYSDTELGEPDECTFSVLCNWSNWRTSCGYARGDDTGKGYAMKVVTCQATQESALTARVAIVARGMAVNDDKRRRELSCAGQVISIGPVEKTVLVWGADDVGEDPDGGDKITPKRRIPKLQTNGEIDYKEFSLPTGLADRWEVTQAFLKVVDTYLTATEPASNLIGTNVTPPSAPTPPADRFGSYSDTVRRRDPYGWVLDDRNARPVTKNGPWVVTDSYGYYYPQRPD